MVLPDARFQAHDFYISIENRVDMKRRTKYGSVRTEVDGISFASKAEAKRYLELKLLESVGEISEFLLQPRYPLRIDGSLICTYVADFYYREKGKNLITVEDKKGMKTPVFIIKERLFRALYPQYKLLIT